MEVQSRFPELLCPVCSKTFGEREVVPRMLPCGHNHCLQCLNNMFRNNNIVCCLCSGWIVCHKPKQLPINYSLLNLKSVILSRDTSSLESKEFDSKILSLVNNIDEMTQEFKISLRDTKQKMADIGLEKRKLSQLRKTFHDNRLELVKSKSLEESSSNIKSINEKMKTLDVQKKIIEEKLVKGQIRLKIESLARDSSSNIHVTKLGITTACFVSTQKIYMYSFSRYPNLKSNPIDYFDLEKYFSGVFMIVEYEGRQTKLEFKVILNPRGKQFLSLCQDASTDYVGALFSCHTRVEREGEFAVLGFADGDPRSMAPNNHFRKEGSFGGIRRGFLEGFGNDKKHGTHFRIYFEDWSRKKSPFCFGRLTRGLSILKSIMKSGCEAKVTGCGLIFDPFADRPFHVSL